MSPSPDSKKVITAGRDGLDVWEVATGEESGPLLRPGSDRVRGNGVLSPEGRLLATPGFVTRDREGPSDPAIRIWDLAAGQEVATLQGHEPWSPILNLARWIRPDRYGGSGLPGGTEKERHRLAVSGPTGQSRRSRR